MNKEMNNQTGVNNSSAGLDTIWLTRRIKELIGLKGAASLYGFVEEDALDEILRMIEGDVIEESTPEWPENSTKLMLNDGKWFAYIRDPLNNGSDKYYIKLKLPKRMKRTNNDQPGAKSSSAALTQTGRNTVLGDALKSRNGAHEFCENCINPDRERCGMSNR